MLTSSEIRYFKSFGSSIVEATAMSLTASVSYSLLAWQHSRPHLRRAWVFLVWMTAFTVALGMVSRDIWESARPRIISTIDQIVESGYSTEPVMPEPEPTEPEPITEPETETVTLPIAAKTMKSAIAVVIDPVTPPKRGIRELRLEAKARGIKGASRMNLQQLAEHGICK